jgi:hypothetical protein
MHSAILAKHAQYGNEINESKSQYSTIFVWYCEELLRYRQKSIGCGRPPWLSNYQEENVHLDVVKMRLLSPFASTSSDQRDEKNPAIGKGDALWEFFSNIQRVEIKDFVRHTYFNWMSSFISEDPMIFLPKVVGGCNVPFVGDRKELFRKIIDHTGPIIATIYRKLRYEMDPPFLFSVLTRRMSTGNTARGVIDPMTHSAVAQYAHIAFQQFQDQAKDLDFFLKELQESKSYPVSKKDALREAKRRGFISYGGIADNLDRLTAMRIMFAAAAGAFPLEEILPSKRERLPTPSQVLKEFTRYELPRASRLYGATPEDFQVSPEDVTSFRDWILEGAPSFVSHLKQYWVPSESITDSLNGMSVRIPHVAYNKRAIPGSVNDESRDPTMVGYASTVISLKRLKR